VTTQPSGEEVPGAVGPASNRTQIIVLAIVSSVLILGVLALLIHFLTRGNPAGTGLEVVGTFDPPAVPTATSSPDAVADDAAARFTFFTAQTEVQCPPGGEGIGVQFSWESESALEAWFAIGDEDALDDDFMAVPLSGDQDDLAERPVFPCGQREYQDYTLKLVGSDGAQATETFRVIDLNWNHG
jgi:hypothetical protein